MSKSQIGKDILLREIENEGGFEKPVGLGDAVERALNTFGITEERFKKAFKLDECGCSKRKEFKLDESAWSKRKEWLNKFATLYHEKKLLDS